MVNVRVEDVGVFTISEEGLEQMARRAFDMPPDTAVSPPLGAAEPTVNNTSTPPLQTIRSPNFQRAVLSFPSTETISEEHIGVNQYAHRNPNFMEEFLAIDPGQMFNVGTITGSSLYPTTPTYHTTTSSPSTFSSPVFTASDYRKPCSLFDILPGSWGDQIYEHFFNSILDSGSLTARVFNNLQNIRIRHLLGVELTADLSRQSYADRTVKAILTSQIESPLGIKVPSISSNFLISNFDIRDRLGGVSLEEGFKHSTETAAEGVSFSLMRKFIEKIGDKLKDPKKDPLFFKEFVSDCLWDTPPLIDISPLLLACAHGSTLLLKDTALLATMPTIGSKINQPNKNPAKPEVQDPTQGQLF